MNIVGEIKQHFGDDFACLRFSEDRTSFSIDIVMVPPDFRGRGIGSGLIRHILVLADSLGKNVRVSARPLGSMSEERLQRLVTYYRRFGFEEVDRGLSAVHMVRGEKAG